MSSAYQCFHCAAMVEAGELHNCTHGAPAARFRWRRYRIGDLLPAAEGGDRMRTSNTNYMASDPSGFTITTNTMRSEQVYMLWQRKQHVATMRVPVDDDGARRAALCELQRRAEEC